MSLTLLIGVVALVAGTYVFGREVGKFGLLNSLIPPPTITSAHIGRRVYLFLFSVGFVLCTLNAKELNTTSLATKVTFAVTLVVIFACCFVRARSLYLGTLDIIGVDSKKISDTHQIFEVYQDLFFDGRTGLSSASPKVLALDLAGDLASFLMKDRDWRIRRRAALVFYLYPVRIADAQPALEALVDGINDKDIRVANMCINSIIRIGNHLSKTGVPWDTTALHVISELKALEGSQLSPEIHARVAALRKDLEDALRRYMARE
jgi:hypothetical protein